MHIETSLFLVYVVRDVLPFLLAILFNPGSLSSVHSSVLHLKLVLSHSHFNLLKANKNFIYQSLFSSVWYLYIFNAFWKVNI